MLNIKLDNEKKHYVIWSGGLDSTVLLHTLARVSIEDNPIVAISINHHQIHKDKELMEKKAREKYLKFAKRNRYHISHHTLNINCDTGIWPQGHDQATIWSVTILPYIKHNSVLHFGYIKEDDFWHGGRVAFDTIINGLSILRQAGDPFYVEMAYDLEWESKANLINYANDNLPNGSYWYCEAPKKAGRGFKSCGTCGCCERHDAAKIKARKLKTLESVEVYESS
jgi:7-cyano-7-deazaguanine synthase in queuosine biosynthesis